MEPIPAPPSLPPDNPPPPIKPHLRKKTLALAIFWILIIMLFIFTPLPHCPLCPLMFSFSNPQYQYEYTSIYNRLIPSPTPDVIDYSRYHETSFNLDYGVIIFAPDTPNRPKVDRYENSVQLIKDDDIHTVTSLVGQTWNYSTTTEDAANIGAASVWWSFREPERWQWRQELQGWQLTAIVADSLHTSIQGYIGIFDDQIRVVVESKTTTCEESGYPCHITASLFMSNPMPLNQLIPTPTPTPVPTLPAIQTYINEAHGYSLQFSPRKFKQLDCKDDSFYLEASTYGSHSPTVCGNRGNPYDIEIHTYDVPRETPTSDEYYRISKEAITIGGFPASKYVFTLLYEADPEGMPWPDNYVVIHLPYHSKYHIIYFSNNSYYAELQTILSTWKFLQ